MTLRLNRRSFLSTAAAAAAASLLDPLSRRLHAFPLEQSDDFPDIAVARGTNYYDLTLKAVEMMGGMGRFVSHGSRVGLVVNSSFDKPGTFTKPQIALAVGVLCMQAGAKEIIGLEGTPGSYWRRAVLSGEHRDLVAGIKEPHGAVEVPIKGGKRLKQIEITRDFLECDVLINLPVFKDHEGTRFTGNLKNIMGTTGGSTNRFFHLGSGASGYYADPVHLSECIAEANLVRKPALCIGDGTEVISTNGPFGPGKVIRPQTVVAGTDPVAVDAFGATLLGLVPEQIVMISKAAELGIGSLDLASKKIRRAEV